jgi:hypothetical protein
MLPLANLSEVFLSLSILLSVRLVIKYRAAGSLVRRPRLL